MATVCWEVISLDREKQNPKSVETSHACANVFDRHNGPLPYYVYVYSYTRIYHYTIA